MRGFGRRLAFGFIAYWLIIIFVLVVTVIRNNSTIVTANSTTYSYPEYSDKVSLNQLLNQINQFRSQNNLAPVVVDTKLNNLAQGRALDMSINEYYAHKNLVGKFYSDYFSREGIAPTSSCENLNLDSGMNPAKFVQGWMHSPDHKKCLLDPNLTKIGLATERFQGADTKGAPLPMNIVVAIHANL